ncbi:phosphotyrosine-specific ptp2-like protein [Massospora cicadina]|nr:phosphotyrosine-specific ptp2-like protein [Massospora cicadina]
MGFGRAKIERASQATFRMSVSFKPTSIALPDSTSFFKRSSTHPSVKFQTDPSDRSSVDPNHPNPTPPQSRPFPKTPYPTEVSSNSPESQQCFFSLSPKGLTNCFIQEISSKVLIELISSDPKPLIIDLRPTIHFAKIHIPNSISVSVPSTLLRRESHDLEKVASGWRDFGGIVFVDANSSSISDASPISQLFRKFLLPANTAFFWLKGGFKHFQAAFPDRVSASKVPLLSSVSNSISAPNLGPLTFPVPGRGDTINRAMQFYDSLRQYNTASNTLAETILSRCPIPAPA